MCLVDALVSFAADFADGEQIVVIAFRVYVCKGIMKI